MDSLLRNPESYPPDLGHGRQIQIASPRDIWGVVAVLESTYDWNDDEMQGFLGENLMLVCEDNWN